jgi:hypothetical protein
MPDEKNGKIINADGIMVLITVITIVTQSGLHLLTGGFAAGGKLSEINSEVRLLRHEVAAANKIQDYRLEKLEAARN